MALLLSSSGLFAAEWSVVPAYQTRGQFNDNITLTTRPHNSVWAVWLNPSVQMQYATEILSFQAHPEFEYVQYFGNSQNDKTFANFFLPFKGSYHTEVDRFGFNVVINRDIALLGELQETGIVTNFIQRQTNTAGGNWERVLTERLFLDTGYQFRYVNYDKGEESGLFDFQTHTGSFGPRYEFTEETQFHGTAYYTNTHFEDFGFRSQSLGGEVGITQRIFETYTVTLNGGGRNVWTTSTSNGIQSKNTKIVWLVNASLVKEWERSNASVAYSRTLNPSGRGVLLATDRVSVDVDHELTERITASLKGTWTMNDTVGSSSERNRIQNTRFWQIAPAVSWRLREDWLLRFSYTYRQRNRNVQGGDSSGTAKSNSVDLSLTYTWPKWSLSR